MHPNAQIVADMLTAFGQDDMATLKELFADDAVLHASGRHRWSGDTHGADAIVRQLRELRDELTISSEPHAFLGDDDHVVLLLTNHLTKGDKNFVNNVVHTFHVEDGNVTEWWSIPIDQYGLDEFLAG